MSRRLRLLGLAAFLGLATSAGDASAGVPIPIIYGEGEEVEHVADLPPDLRQEAQRELGHDVAVGFYYKRAHVYYLSLWTWGGKHVFYHGDQYWDPGPGGVEKLLGKTAAGKLSTPFFYQFPLGLVLIGGMVTLGVVWPRVFPSELERAKRLLKDERYQSALDEFARAVSPPEGSTTPPLSHDAAIELAARHLRDQGVPAEQAEPNMRLLIRVLSASAPAA